MIPIWLLHYFHHHVWAVEIGYLIVLHLATFLFYCLLRRKLRGYDECPPSITWLNVLGFISGLFVIDFYVGFLSHQDSNNSVIESFWIVEFVLVTSLFLAYPAIRVFCQAFLRD